jgi:hypothetical protein
VPRSANVDLRGRGPDLQELPGRTVASGTPCRSDSETGHPQAARRRKAPRCPNRGLRTAAQQSLSTAGAGASRSSLAHSIGAVGVGGLSTGRLRRIDGEFRPRWTPPTKAPKARRSGSHRRQVVKAPPTAPRPVRRAAVENRRGRSPGPAVQGVARAPPHAVAITARLLGRPEPAGHQS